MLNFENQRGRILLYEKMNNEMNLGRKRKCKS